MPGEVVPILPPRAAREMAKKKTKMALFQQLGEYDGVTAMTRIVDREELVGDYRGLQLVNGGAWFRNSVIDEHKFVIVRGNGRTDLNWEPTEDENNALRLKIMEHQKARLLNYATSVTGRAVAFVFLWGKHPTFSRKGTPYVRPPFVECVRRQPCDPAPLTPQQQYCHLFESMYALCREQGWGDPFSYARSREILMANRLGHRISKTLSGADAVDAENSSVEYEYKSTVASSINATYNGISKYPTWEEQVHYLKHTKIGKYEWHFFARFHGGRIEEIWQMSGARVLELISPKLSQQYHSNSLRKDPRLGTSLTTTEIQRNAVCIYRT